jgi:plasmid maintenance system antidote protein VapI
MVTILYTFGDGDKKIFVQIESVREALAQAAQNMLGGDVNDLAHVLRVDRTVVSNWSAGRRPLPPKAQIKLAVLLDVPVELVNALVTPEDEQPQPVAVEVQNER